MKNRRPLLAIVASTIFLTSQTASAAGAANFMTQNVALAPFSLSHTFVVHGNKTPAGDCAYRYPSVSVPPNVTRWEVRDVGIDTNTCTKLVEEGVPGDSEAAKPANQLAVVVGSAEASSATQASSATTASSVASGHTSAWFEDVAGIHVTQDTTYISWIYNGSCVSAGSSSGQWSWDSLFTLVSHGGTNSYSGCSYFLGDTWSTMRTVSLPCVLLHVSTYYNHVRAYGWRDGTMSANRDDSWDSGGCPLPLWEHWSYART